MLCFLAGANSIFYGDKLLVTGNPDVEADRDLLRRVGLTTRTRSVGDENPLHPIEG
ncbi:Biotin synthase [Hydrogenophaga sp. T4]|nr:Biotin synthase [Hydrogenophaga sp. T4]